MRPPVLKKVTAAVLRPDLTDFFTVQSIKRCVEPLLWRTDEDELLITLDDFSSPFSLRKEKSPSLFFQESAVPNPLTRSRDKSEIHNSKRGHVCLKFQARDISKIILRRKKKILDRKINEFLGQYSYCLPIKTHPFTCASNNQFKVLHLDHIYPNPPKKT